MPTTLAARRRRHAGEPRSGRAEPRPFDFRHPSTMSREHVRALQIVQETLAHGFTTVLASTLRCATEVSIGEVSQRPYDEYVRSLPNPTLLTELALPPLDGGALLQLPLPAAFAATELLLGGRGGPDQPSRAMTELERGLMRNIVELTLPTFRAALEPIVAVEPAIVGQEANPQFAQLASPTDMVIVISFDLRIESVSEVMTLCLPFDSLQPSLEALSSAARRGALAADKLAEERARLHANLAAAPVEAAATFRPLVASSSQIVALRIGDVLMMNHPVEMPLTLHVDGTAVHDVHIGRVNRHYAIRIDDSVEAGRHRRACRLQVAAPGSVTGR